MTELSLTSFYFPSFFVCFWLVCLTGRSGSTCSFHYLTHWWRTWSSFICIFLDLLSPQEGWAEPLCFFVSSPFTDNSLFWSKGFNICFYLSSLFPQISLILFIPNKKILISFSYFIPCSCLLPNICFHYFFILISTVFLIDSLFYFLIFFILSHLFQWSMVEFFILFLIFFFPRFSPFLLHFFPEVKRRDFLLISPHWGQKSGHFPCTAAPCVSSSCSTAGQQHPYLIS